MTPSRSDTARADARRSVSNPERLRSLFTPGSVAIVGASETSSWARNLVHTLSLVPGTHTVVPVHPKHSEQFGLPGVPTLRDLGSSVDLAFVLVGPDKVESVLTDAAAAGIRNAVVLAGDYGESGEEGRERQRSLTRTAVELDITLLGPNTIGYLNAREGFAPWAVATAAAPLAGPLGAVFESGSLARATFQFAQGHGVGSSIWASVGNSAVVDALDVLELLVDDDHTRAVALFLETIRDAPRFLTLARAALEAGKPLVALKAGRSEEGRRSGMAHTGAMATDDAVVAAAFAQAGVVRVDSLEELVATGGLFAHHVRRPAGPRMGVVTSSGGGCNIIADMASREGLDLPGWAPETLGRLREALPPFASLLNPLDTTGYGHARERARPTKAEDDLLEMASPDPGVDFLFTMMTPLPPAQPQDPEAREAIEQRMAILGGIVRDAPVPVFLSSNTCLDVADYPRRLLADNGLHLLPGADLGLTAVGHVARWSARRDHLLATAPELAGVPVTPLVTSGPDGPWAEDEGRELLASFGADLVPARLAGSVDEAEEAFAAFDGPVSLKVCSREVAHKSDVGGVALDLGTAADVRRAYTEVLGAVSRAVPAATVRGVLISPMRPPGIELIVGITVDAQFGPVLAVGLGGIWVEVLRDTALRVLPVSARDVREMVEGLRGAPLLSGARGQAAVDLDRLCRSIVGICDAALALALGDRLETLEVNPLRVGPAGPEGLDVLVTTSPRGSGADG